MDDRHWKDPSILEAASWRLASEIVRRHPTTVRMIRAHPGGGQSDCLMLLPLVDGRGDVRLNRVGTIQVLERFDGREPDWPPTTWDTYLRADPRDFLHRLEVAAGLPSPQSVPASTNRSLTLRLLATISATAVKSVHPIEITSGYVDDGLSGQNDEAFEAFPSIPRELREPRPDDFYDQHGYRFWFVLRDQVPVLAVEQEQGLAWTQHHEQPCELMELYDESRRHLLVTALKLLRRVDQV